MAALTVLWLLSMRPLSAVAPPAGQTPIPPVQGQANWLELRRVPVVFPNGVRIEVHIGHSRKPGRFVTRFSPNEKHILVAEGPELFSPLLKHYLYDLSGNRIGLLYSGYPFYTGRWSRSGRYIFGPAIVDLPEGKLPDAQIAATGLFDMQERKLLNGDETMLFETWSLKEDTLLYAADTAFRKPFVIEVKEEQVSQHPIPRKDLTRLMGDAFLKAVSVAQTVSNIPPTPIAQYFRDHIFTQSFLPSPDGRRVLLQNIRHHIVHWTESDEDTCFYYIIEKQGVRFRETSSGNRETIYMQWLDNRFLVGWFHPTEEDYDDKTYLLSKKVKMVLWDTDTGQMWRAPFPRHYHRDALSFHLLPSRKPVKRISDKRR